MKILFTLVGGPNEKKELFYRDVDWPDNAPIPRADENLTIGNLFPCEVERVFWAIDTPANEHLSNEPFLTIICRFGDNINLLYEAMESGFLTSTHPYFPNF